MENCECAFLVSLAIHVEDAFLSSRVFLPDIRGIMAALAG